MNSEEIFKIVKEIVVDQLGVRDEVVMLGTAFVEDLGADSLDMVELVMAIEEEFEIRISDDDAERFVTVGDAVDYINGTARR